MERRSLGVGRERDEPAAHRRDDDAGRTRSGRINHALAITIPHPRAGVVAWPAQRTDGTGTSAELPEGAHLRLNPQLNIPAMHLPKIVEMIALAAQRYGIIVRDQSDADIGFFAEDPTQYGAKR